MICKDFQYWILTRDVLTDKENPDVLDHLQECNSCRKLYDIDTGLEKQIKTVFHQQEIPKGLYDQIELTLDHANAPGIITKRRFTGFASSFALIFAVIFMFFFNKPFRYQTLHELSEKAVVMHMKGNTAISFTADEVEQAVGMLTKELKFNVILPDLKDQGCVLIGGRLCTLGDCKIAYLFYKKEDKVSSLAIMDYDHLDFEMADGSRFSNDIKGYHADIWKEKGQVYAMVY